ncbi:hypothetical protein, partial [Escherichia coli]|uniref:hypothetical protein n=1 Tax=Escherichia coli TaxID=562 RepID=UPI0021E8AF8E
TADRNRSHWSTSKTPSYTKSVSWQHHRIFYYTTRFIYALKFAVAMTIANMGYQALCLYIDNSFAITRISPLWAGLIGVCTFIAALLLTSKR